MYSSRKTKVRFAKGNLLAGGLTGLSLGADTQATVPVKPVPEPSPPSPLPPSPTQDVGSEADGADEYDEYTQHAKQQAKNKLESITGRLFQVLNDYEDDHTENEQLKADLEERNNIQSMITDYRDTCTEREDLLTSLAEWFEDDHIDSMLDDIGDRRVSVAANTDGLRLSLMEGKQTSLKLKAINERILSAENRGLNTEQLKLEKEELEKELMTKINLVDEIEGVSEDRPGLPGMPPKTMSTAVTDSWKFAAVEICNMLHQVRDSGSEELHELDDKIQQLLASMNQQTQVIEQLNGEIQQQRQMAMFADQTTIKLSNDNSLLHEEVEMLRSQLIEAKHTISSLQADLHKMELKAEFESKRATAANQKKVVSSKNRPKSSAVGKKDGDGSSDAQISDLCMEVATLTQENNELKLTVENVEREFDDARQYFEAELERYRTEMERLLSSSEQKLSVRESSNTLPSHPPPLATIPEQKTEESSPMPAPLPAPRRKTSQTQPEANVNNIVHNTNTAFSYSERRKSSMNGKEVQLLQIKLLDKDNQLQKAQEHADRLQEQVIALEKELLSMRKENDGLMKLQEKSAALIGQASTCLQIKSEQKQNSYSETCREWSAKKERVSSGKQPRAPVTNTTSDVHASLPVEPPTQEAQTETKEVCEQQQQTQSEESPNYWSVMGSLDNGGHKFGMPEERTEDEKKAESLHLVVKLIEQVNGNEMDFTTADSKALKQVQSELQKICRLVTKFVEYSSNLVNDEADVMSNAMDSLMAHLPEDEKQSLPVTGGQTQPTTTRQGARMSIAEVKYFDRNKLKEKVVRFADQAIDVLKAGERALSTKINAQKKDLQTVLHAMTDHKRRQSTAFKYTPPDVKDLMLEAHAVSTHDISARKSHVLQQSQTQTSTPSERRKVLIERLRRYSRSQGNPILHTPPANYDVSTYKAFKGVGSNLFMVNTGRGLGGNTFSIAGTGTLQTGLSRAANNTERRDANSFLQINSTHAVQESPPTSHGHPSHGDHAVHVSKRKKAKLYKPFHFNSPLDGESPYTPKITPTVKSTRQTKAKNPRSRKHPATVTKDPLSTTGGSDGTTFFDLLSHSNTVGNKKASDDNQTIKLPPLANL